MVSIYIFRVLGLPLLVQVVSSVRSSNFGRDSEAGGLDNGVGRVQQRNRNSKA